MSLLLRLYPRAWRERYGDELTALLAERPPSLVDHLDLVRGAVDARLHPQVPGAATPSNGEFPALRRPLGIAAGVGGIAWVLGLATLLILPKDLYGEPNMSVAALALALANTLLYVALAELGSRAGSAASGRTGHAVSYLGFLLGVTLALGWPLFIVGFYAFPVISFLLAARGSRNGAFPAWIGPVFGVASVAMMVGGLGGIATEINVLLIGVPGLAAFVLAGLAFSRRPAVVTSDAA